MTDKPLKVYGPYTRSDGRRHVILYDGHHRQTVSYPKYLIEQHLGIKLTDNETVDHIDGDSTNDAIENLRVVSRLENINYYLAKLGQAICRVCNIEFDKKFINQQDCSKKCHYAYWNNIKRK